MLKVIIMLECNQCHLPLSTIYGFKYENVDDISDCEAYLIDLPLYAKRFAGWHQSNNYHLCPECDDQLNAEAEYFSS